MSNENDLTLTINPEIQKVNRPLTQIERENLKALIIEKGLYDHCIQVMADEQTIIDGHNRYGLAKELGLPITKEKILVHPEIDTIQKAKEFASNTQSGRIEKPFERCERVYRGCYDSVVNSQPKGERVDEILARKSQVGQQTFSRAKKIIESGTPIQIEQLRLGKLSINKAYEEIIHNHEVLDQREIQSRMQQILTQNPMIEGTVMIYDRHLDRPIAYETSKGVTCLGCGLLCESNKAFTEHVIRSTERGKCLSDHFKEFHVWGRKNFLWIEWKKVFDEKLNREVCIIANDQKED